MQVSKGLAQVILDQLREAIYDGRHEPGARLNIADLAKEASISPLPVREALRTLETEGLIELRHNRGAVVTVLTAADIREIFLVRAPLEEVAATEAARVWTSVGQLDALERTLKQMDRRPPGREWYRLHHRFHMQLVSLSGFPRIVKILGVYRGQMRGLVKLHLGEMSYIEQMQSEHYAMVDYLRKRDTQGIRLLVRKHIERPVRVILTAMGAPDFKFLEPAFHSAGGPRSGRHPAAG